MDKYENLGIIGEGSYGVVMKCRRKQSGQLVAVKKFLVKMNDELVRKVATREIKMLKMLKHENLVNLIDAFRRKGHLYLIMDYVDHNLLDELHKHPNGLSDDNCRPLIWQILRGVDFCHTKNIIHRDIKPENVLVSQTGVVKLCDFGFARTVSSGEACTDYVSTRWYRAPELLVGDLRYGKEVDVWAVGCLFAEMYTGNPLFPGDSDIDQLFCIKKIMGDLIPKHKELIAENAVFCSFNSAACLVQPLQLKFLTWPKLTLDFLQNCLNMNPLLRSSASAMLQHGYFTWDDFPVIFYPVLYNKMKKEFFPSSQPPDLIDLKCLSSSANVKKTASNLPNLKKQTTDKSSIGVSLPANESGFLTCVPAISKPLEKLQISASKGAESPVSDSGEQSQSSGFFMPPIVPPTLPGNRDYSSKSFRTSNNASRNTLNCQKIEKQKTFNSRSEVSVIPALRSPSVFPKTNATDLRLLGKRASRHILEKVGDVNSGREQSGWLTPPSEVTKNTRKAERNLEVKKF